MAQLRRTSRVRGSLFDVAALSALPDDDCHFLFVNSRTLYLMQHFARYEVNFLARYAESFPEGGGWYEPVDLNSPNVDLVLDIARQYRLEVSVTDCNALIGAINDLTQAVISNNCGCPVGQGNDNESGEFGGPVPGPIGDITYSEVNPSASRTCKAAHWITDNYINILTEMDNANIDSSSSIALTAMVSLVVAIIGAAAAGPFGAVLGAVAGIYIALSTDIIGGGLDFNALVTAMIANRSDLICALYAATSADDARTDFNQVLTDAGVGLANTDFMALMMPNAILNNLFFKSTDSAESAIQAVVPDVDCSTCPSLIWTFDQGVENWDFQDQSDLPASQVGQWNPLGGLEVIADLPAVAMLNCEGRWRSDLVGQAIGADSPTAICSFSGPSDSINTSYKLRLVWLTAGQEEVELQTADPGTHQITVNSTVTSDTLQRVQWRVNRTKGAAPGDPWNWTQTLDFVKVSW